MVKEIDVHYVPSTTGMDAIAILQLATRIWIQHPKSRKENVRRSGAHSSPPAMHDARILGYCGVECCYGDRIKFNHLIDRKLLHMLISSNFAGVVRTYLQSYETMS